MAGVAAEKATEMFDVAWSILQEEAINKVIANLEIGLPGNTCLTPADFMRFYTVVYDLAGSKLAPNQRKLYDQYKRTFEDYVSSKVLPALRGKEDENLLRELLRRWNDNKTLTRWLSKIFCYLDRFYIFRRMLPSLAQTSHWTFYDLVFGEIKDQVGGAIAALVDREREGEQIDQALVKQVLDIFEEIGEESLQNYANDIEGALGKVNPFCYTRKDLEREAKSCEDKVNKCFERERTRVSESFRVTNKEKVLEVYKEIKDRVCGSIVSLIDRECQGEKFVQAMSKEVKDIFEEIGDPLKAYARDIEEALLEATALYYSKKALHWIGTMSYKDYMDKVEECLEKEKTRVSQYLKLINKNKMVEVVQHELLNVHADKLEEKKASRFRRSRL